MSQSVHTLLFPLIGPMQSWGSRSRFDDRDTHPEPTKSGVIGLVCAALGYERSRNIEHLTALRFGVRVDAPGRAMVDYHTAQNVIRASGSGTSSVTSQRHYLADARFLVGLEGADLALLERIEAALHAPIWTLALGRKSFPLTVPPYLPGGSIRQNIGLEAAIQAEPWRLLLPWEKMPEQLRVVLEDDRGSQLQLDQPLHFEARQFGLRRLHTILVPRPQEVLEW